MSSIASIIVASLAGCIALHDLISIKLPTRISKSFEDFISAEDLKPPPGVQYEKRQHSQRKAWAIESIALIGLLAHLGLFAYCLVSNTQGVVDHGLTALVWAFVAVRTASSQLITPPYATLLLVLSQIGIGLANIVQASLFTHEIATVIWSLARCLHAMAIFGTIASLPVLETLRSENTASINAVPTADETSSEDRVTLWQWMTFSFVKPLLKLASTSTIREENVYALPPTLKHANLLRKFRDTYQDGTSLIWWLIRQSSLDLTIYVAGKLYNCSGGYIVTYSVKRIIDALESDNRREAYLFAIITLVTNLSFAQFDLLSAWHSRRCYERTRGLLFCIVFEKALKRRDPTGSTIEVEDKDTGEASGTKKASADLGKVYNVARNDTYAVAQRFWDGADVFVAPISLIISLVFLYEILGWSALIGSAIALVSVCIQYPLGRLMATLARRSLNARDRCNTAVTELLGCLRFLKLSAWELEYLKRVTKARQTALRWRVIQNLGSMAFEIILTLFPKAVLVLTFWVYTTYQKQELTIATAFVSISLFARLENSMLELPNAILSYINATVSVRRLQAFLDEPDVEPWVCSLTAPAITQADDSVGFQHATFEWHAAIRSGAKSEDKAAVGFQLRDLNFAFKRAELNLVCGETASGKSSLLASLLGEMDCVSGQVLLRKAGQNVAYCAQSPWLENKTIQNNILFSSPFDQARYDATLHACALLPDLAILDAGDQTEVGERGISLSGGQKARIALARAVYSHAQIVLLDDPLAAVDSHTARHLVENCFRGSLMVNRTIVLVTHHVSLCTGGRGFLVELENGRVAASGTLDDLRAAGKLAKMERREAKRTKEVQETQEATQQTTDMDKEGEKVKRDKHDGKLVTVEQQVEGRVSFKTYLTYIRACGYLCWLIIVLCFFSRQAQALLSQYFLQAWGNAYHKEGDVRVGPVKLPSPGKDAQPWILVYLAISLLLPAVGIIRNIVGIFAMLQASRTVFNALIYRLTRSSFRWLDQTPRGRIMNRTVSDISVLDGTLFNSLAACMTGTIAFLISFGVILFLIPAFAPFALLIASCYILIAPPYIKGSRDLRRLESISLSPFFQGFDQMLHGLATVRAFAAEHRYLSAACLDVDRFQRHDKFYWHLAFWINYRYDILGSFIVFATTFAALYSQLSAGLVAILIVQTAAFADASRFLIRRFSQVQLDYNSMERISEYTEIPLEAAVENEKSRPPAYWPSTNGGIQFENMSARYAPNLPDVLRKVNLVIEPRQKVALVGRTGSGKSTLALSVLRALEAHEGRILIDGIDISKMGLHDLRKRITLVAQDVVLFEGNVRSNLDPLGEHTDAEIEDVLQRCYLMRQFGAASIPSSAPGSIHEKSTIAFRTLEDKIAADGASLSQGQRQLLALARALIRRSNILIMDEASSSIDNETDYKIQRTIRDELGDTLTLTIAHRLITVIDYDKVVLLDRGEIVETGTPHELLRDESSAFRQMCEQSADWPALSEAAGIAL